VLFSNYFKRQRSCPIGLNTTGAARWLAARDSSHFRRRRSLSTAIHINLCVLTGTMS
jgi:hypothetical protein